MSLLTSGDKGNLAHYGMGADSSPTENMWSKKEKEKEARKGKC